MSASSLASLLKQTHIDDDEEVLKAANTTLRQSKGDLEAQHVKLVALLKLDRYDDALKVLEDGGERLKERARLEHAYALYKTGKPAAAANLVSKSSERGSQHLEAQARYRTEDFKRAAEIYKQLAASPEDDAEADLRINSGAVDAQLEWAGYGELVQKKKPGREDLDAFETAYNAACGSIARGELGQGEVLLRRAKDLCSSVEEMSNEEKQAELLPITVQQIYVLNRLGRHADAEVLAQNLDIESISDASTKNIARVNNVATRGTNNPYVVQRIVSKDLGYLKPDYPFGFQSSVLKRNIYASDLQSLKYSGTANSTAASIAEHASPTTNAFYNSLSVVNAAAHARSQTGKKALKYMLPLLQRRPKDVGLVLTVTQQYILTANSGSAISLLENFLSTLERSDSTGDQDARFAPGLVGALVSLYNNQGQRSHARTELSKAVTYWRRKPEERPSGYVQLSKAAGSSLLQSGEDNHQQLARDIFDELHIANPEDRYAAAGVLAASPERATGKTQLTSIDRLLADIDVDSLESAGIAQLPSGATAASTRKRAAEDTKPKKAKKLRKSRMPKDFDPKKKLDPERWLPLRDRSTYRPKGKKAKARQALFSQGAAAADVESSRPATPGGDIVKQKQSGGGGQNKKKKGKGGKW